MEQGKDDHNMKKGQDRVLRTARGSGRWFPASEKALSAMVGDFIKKADVPAMTGRVVAAIAPHAGYIYSGKVAGYTFKALQSEAAGGRAPETVVILGFSHRNSFRGVALMDGDAFVSPMGTVALDKEAAEGLAVSSQRMVIDYSLHGDEHSAENEVPFVQAALPGARLVIALIGDHDGETVNELAAALAALAKKKKILVVASTDMLHDPDYALVSRTDKGTLERVAAMDSVGLTKSWSMDHQVFCGMMPVLTAMKFAELQGCRTASVLYYRNSGDDFPESRGSWVVGYGAVVFAVPE